MVAKAAAGCPLKRNEDAPWGHFAAHWRDRLAATAKSYGVELKRIRRQVAFDRLLASLLSLMSILSVWVWNTWPLPAPLMGLDFLDPLLTTSGIPRLLLGERSIRVTPRVATESKGHQAAGKGFAYPVVRARLLLQLLYLSCR